MNEKSIESHALKQVQARSIPERIYCRCILFYLFFFNEKALLLFSFLRKTCTQKQFPIHSVGMYLNLDFLPIKFSLLIKFRIFSN